MGFNSDLFCINLRLAWLCWLSSLQYSSAGCLLNLHHSEKPDHEEVCEFRPYTCPCPGATCKWHGSLEAVMPHLMHAHKSITTLQVSTRIAHMDDLQCWSWLFCSAVSVWTWLCHHLCFCLLCAPPLFTGGGHRFPGDGHQPAGCRGLGYDAVLFQPPLHAGFREARKVRGPPAVLCCRAAHRDSQAGRELRLPARAQRQPAAAHLGGHAPLHPWRRGGRHHEQWLSGVWHLHRTSVRRQR